ncbi:MAG: class I SAM-dependent methyltransferase [Candidatus Methanofastidiosia archaeon]
MEHYFSRKPKAKHRLGRIGCTLRGKKFNFLTDSGVFSKDRIDFGSRFLLEVVEVLKSDEILDLGCGYGVLGIALADSCKRVLMIDVNERACILAEINVRENGVMNAEVRLGSLEVVFEKFDCILTNPPIKAGKKKIFELIEKSRKYLKKDGRFYLVARTKLGAKSLAKHMLKTFGNVETVAKKGGYRVFKSCYSQRF